MKFDKVKGRSEERDWKGVFFSSLTKTSKKFTGCLKAKKCFCFAI